MIIGIHVLQIKRYVLGVFVVVLHRKSELPPIDLCNCTVETVVRIDQLCQRVVRPCAAMIDLRPPNHHLALTEMNHDGSDRSFARSIFGPEGYVAATSGRCHKGVKVNDIGKELTLEPRIAS